MNHKLKILKKEKILWCLGDFFLRLINYTRIEL